MCSGISRGWFEPLTDDIFVGFRHVVWESKVRVIDPAEMMFYLDV